MSSLDHVGIGPVSEKKCRWVPEKVMFISNRSVNDTTRWIQVHPKKILSPPNRTLNAFQAADPWIHRAIYSISSGFAFCFLL